MSTLGILLGTPISLRQVSSTLPEVHKGAILIISTIFSKCYEQINSIKKKQICFLPTSKKVFKKVPHTAGGSVRIFLNNIISQDIIQQDITLR